MRKRSAGAEPPEHRGEIKALEAENQGVLGRALG
jgi:hypothetical protein